MDTVNELVAQLKKAFGLGEWTIYVRRERHEENDGYATTDAKYRVAYLDIAPDLDEERLVHVVYHEMGHVWLAELTSPLLLYSHTLEKRQGEYMRELLDYHQERVIEMMAQNLRL